MSHIPVKEASHLAERFHKDSMVIVTRDEGSGEMTFTTWGRSATDKVRAADDAEAIASLLAEGERTNFEDFRTGSAGLDLVAAERKRVIEQEGFDLAHDAQHGNGELVLAAAKYALHDLPPHFREDFEVDSVTWPWDWSWWKPKWRLHNLVRAAQLLVAEIERVVAVVPLEECARASLPRLRDLQASGAISDYRIEPREAGLLITLERGDAHLDRVIAWQLIRDARFDIVAEEINGMVPKIIDG